MFKMGLYDPFEHLKHKLWPKEKLGIKLAIWLPTTKSQGIDPISLHVGGGVWHTVGKLSTKTITLLQTSSQLEVYSKLWGSKVVGIPTLGISKLPFGSPGTKCHLDVGLVERHIIYYKGEDGGFPPVRAVVSLVSLSLPVVHLSTKNVLTMH
jgi:hypothetical protein